MEPLQDRRSWNTLFIRGLNDGMASDSDDNLLQKNSTRSSGSPGSWTNLMTDYLRRLVEAMAVDAAKTRQAGQADQPKWAFCTK